MTIFTVGYEGFSIDAFVRLLLAHNINTLVDVRQLPLSRKHGFSKKLLGDILYGSGIGYAHMPALGCPKPIRDRYKQDSNWKVYTQSFLAYLETQETAISDLAGRAMVEACALMCFEADFNYCHRSMVADAVRDFSGAEVRHISKAGLKIAKAVQARPVVLQAGILG